MAKSDEVKASLKQLRESLDNSVDAETLALAQSLEVDIQRILDTESHTDSHQVSLNDSVDLALALEARFESEHPLTAGVVKELVNALHKMGI